MHRSHIRLLCAAAMFAALAPVLWGAVPISGGGEYAFPKQVPYQAPPTAVLWGPYHVHDLIGLQWGLYGLEYHGLYGRLYAAYYWQNNIHRYRSSDSTNPARPDTIPAGTISSPVSDSFQDMAWCRYDNSIWLHSSKYKQVYKLDAATGLVKRQFPTPAVHYPTGIAFDERAKELYLVDRMGQGVFPCSLFVTDTLGNVLRRHSLGSLGYSYAGARCLDLDYTNTNPNWPSLLLTYTFFPDSNGLDSTVLFELDRTDMHIISRTKLPDLLGNVNNVRGVAWDPRNGSYWIGIMQSPDNYLYKLSGYHTPASPDVGITSQLVPRGPADSGSSVVPEITVRNYGAAQVTFPVRMRIGDDYDQSRSKTLAPVSEDTVVFPAWRPAVVGTHAVRCTTGLTGDVFATNDTWLEYVRVTRPGRDVALNSILRPVGLVDSGATVTPRCTVYNAGSVTVDYDVRMKIGTGYEETTHVTGHIPGVVIGVDFPDWTAGARGTYSVQCSTELAGDTLRSNDRLADSVTVVVHDVGVAEITAPSGPIDSGVPVVPQCKVVNRGSTEESFWTRYAINSTGLALVYSDSSWLTVAAGDSAFADFDTWPASPPGVVMLLSYTDLATDQNRANDTAHGAVTVRRILHDVGAVEIIAPSDTVDTGADVVPAALVQNFGPLIETFPVRFQIGSFYTQDTSATLSPGATDTIRFPAWHATEIGTHAVRCSTMLAGDGDPANDAVEDTVVVPGVGVGEAGKILPQRFALDGGRPNPFSGATLISYALPREAHLALRVYNAAGTLVRVLRDGNLPAGWGRIRWDGRDESGRIVARGVYYCRMETDNFSALKKLVRTN